MKEDILNMKKPQIPKIIKMQYPNIENNNLCDGTIHSILPIDIYEIENYNLYLMKCIDLTKRQNTITILRKNKYGEITKIPLLNYDSLLRSIKNKKIGLHQCELKFLQTYFDSSRIYIKAEKPLKDFESCLREISYKIKYMKDKNSPSRPPLTVAAATPPAPVPPSIPFKSNEKKEPNKTIAKTYIKLYIDKFNNIFIKVRGNFIQIYGSMLLKIMGLYNIAWYNKETNEKIINNDLINRAIWYTAGYLLSPKNKNETHHYTASHQNSTEDGVKKIH